MSNRLAVTILAAVMSVVFMILGVAYPYPVTPDPSGSVLRVAGYSTCKDSTPFRQGTGWVAAPGMVITDAHVIYGDRAAWVEVNGGYQPATVVLYDPQDDLAVLKTNAVLPPALELTQDRTGMTGTLVGYPVHKNMTSGPAQITGSVTNDSTGIIRRLLTVHAQGYKGQSGGPFLTQGRVAGMFELYMPGTWKSWFITPDVIHNVLSRAKGLTKAVPIGGCEPL